ncbi:hypothetical protein EOD41_10875 [Mucilaginibacter limnophilus]|uniref:Uncharacterized protein n=1 Tax=Mucilaginibacter limnophilus TaxID=1932778 RepID=A0A3S2Y191_9SPHI|nr:hypothetical protein [Mucilaginibacter limnophilus]RVU01109.1 hypothetical protein EOD41_10875 [Mucilaginibacter limnophilus]
MDNIREKILSDAKFNTENAAAGYPLIDETTDEIGQRWTRLESFGDLVSMTDVMHPVYVDILNDAADKQRVARDIADGVTFAFWFDANGKLLWER